MRNSNRETAPNLRFSLVFAWSIGTEVVPGDVVHNNTLVDDFFEDMNAPARGVGTGIMNPVGMGGTMLAEQLNETYTAGHVIEGVVHDVLEPSTVLTYEDQHLYAPFVMAASLWAVAGLVSVCVLRSFRDLGQGQLSTLG